MSCSRDTASCCSDSTSGSDMDNGIGVVNATHIPASFGAGIGSASTTRCGSPASAAYSCIMPA